MFEPSSEQSLIIEHIKNGKNVVVDACAGSGKSTTILSCAYQNPNKRFLQITYNSALRKEIKEKVREFGLKNIVVHTFHSLAVAKYIKEAKTDSGIREILYSNLEPVSKILSQDIIVLDETQDMTLLYYQFIVKFMKDMGTPFQMLILGDFMQGLYEFKGADIRFLTIANKIWAEFPLLISREFECCTLKMSYRITNEMAEFVNEVMLGEERLLACKSGEPVIYIRNTERVIIKKVIFIILDLLKRGVKPDEIFILAQSVKGINSKILNIENALVNACIPCYVPMDDTDNIEEKVINGKIVFSTFHSVKGRQRPYVFIVRFDQSYYFNTNSCQEICPNTLYVGCTRATKQLFLLEQGEQYNSDRPLSFLKLSHNEMKTKSYIQFHGYARVIYHDDDSLENRETEIKIKKTTPTELTKFIKEYILEEINPLLQEIFIKESTEEEILEIPVMIETKSGYYEDVSDLNGIAIPAMYYDYLKSEWQEEDDPTVNILYDIIREKIKNLKPNKHEFLREILKTIDTEITEISDYLYLANIYLATDTKLYYKLKQIERNEYNWLKSDILSKCKKRLLKILDTECSNSRPIIEETIINYTDDEKHILIDRILDTYFPLKRIRFCARIDLGSERTIWELKCTTSITQEHLLQVVIYCWIWRTIYPDAVQEFRIFNIKTGEILRLDSSKEILDIIVIKLLKSKYDKYEIPRDDDFLETCKKYM